MAISNTEVQITWAAANSKSVAAGQNEQSDSFSISETAIDAAIMLKADNAGTPAAGDDVAFKLLKTLGDPDGAGADEFSTFEHSELLVVLNTNKEDPAIAVIPINSVWKDAIIEASSSAATNSITVSATMLEKTNA